MKLPWIKVASPSIKTVGHVVKRTQSRFEAFSQYGLTSEAPKYALFAKIYEQFDVVATPIDRIVEEACALEVELIKNKEKVEIDLGKYYSKRNEIVVHLLVFGQVIVIDEGDKFMILPSSECSNWRYSGTEIVSFDYSYQNHIFKITENFKIFKKASFRSQLFGSTPMQSIYDHIRKLDLNILNQTTEYENNSRAGLVIVEPERISLSEKRAMQESIDKLSDPNYHYSAIVFPHGTKVEVVNQRIQEFLNVDEVEQIERLACSRFGYPYRFLAKADGQLGQGEQLTLRTNLLTTLINLQNVEKEIIKHYYKNQFDIIKFSEYKINSSADMMTAIQGLVQSGVLTPAEAKKKLNYEDHEINDEDYQKILAPGTAERTQSYSPVPHNINRKAKKFGRIQSMSELSHYDAVTSSTKHRLMVESGLEQSREYLQFVGIAVYSNLMQNYPTIPTNEDMLYIHSSLDSYIGNDKTIQDVILYMYALVGEYFKPDKKIWVGSKDIKKVEMNKKIVEYGDSFVFSDGASLKYPLTDGINDGGIRYIWT